MHEAVNQIERLLCERYHVPTLDGLGPLPGAIEAARKGDPEPLRQVLAGRELYRWRGAIEEALADLESVQAPVAETVTVEPEPIIEDQQEEPDTFLPDELEAPLAEEPKPRRARK